MAFASLGSSLYFLCLIIAEAGVIKKVDISFNKLFTEVSVMEHHPKIIFFVLVIYLSWENNLAKGLPCFVGPQHMITPVIVNPGWDVALNQPTRNTL